MSTRHRQRRNGATSVLPEDRARRKAEHRRLRRGVNQALHQTTLGDDPEALVLDLPHPTHGYHEDHERPASHAEPAPPRRVRHWKQPFWKRRAADRRRRAMAWNAVTGS